MVYRIEDINWHEMPEGAVEFSLENDEYISCWYNKDGEHSFMGNHRGWHLPIIDPEDPEDNRERYKVSDYHPSTSNNRKPTREKRLEIALGTLIQTYFYGSDLTWRCEDDATLAHIDPDLHKEIVDLLEIGDY